MDAPDRKPTSPSESDNDRLGGLLANDALSLDLVSAFAGDREMTGAEKEAFDDLRMRRGERFFSDLLYAITHQYFEPATAQGLWENILRNKYDMSSVMKRNIRIVVATIDYLSNLTSEMHSATVIGEVHLADIVRLSLHDGLTGLFNHAYCYQRADMEVRRHARYGSPVSVMMIDIDDFKNLNDLHGHQEGDKILARVGAIIDAETRDSDTCCRYGGEEFAVILPSTDVGEAARLAERLRAKMEVSLPCGRRVTVSIGVSSCGEDATTAQGLIKKADAALYRAKTAGKNRIAADP